MIKKIDWTLLIAVILLTIIGLVILHAINFRDPSLAQDFNPTTQIVAALFGFAGLILVARMDYHLWLRLSVPWYLISIGLLLGVLVFGEVTFGAKLAIDLGIIQFQPGEVVKLGLILLLARVYTKNHQNLRRVRWLIWSLILFGIPVVLMLLQPDFGSAFVLGFIWLMMTFMSGIKKAYLVGLVVLALVALPFIIPRLAPYQQQRIQTFFDPTSDPQGAGYNVNQSTIAIGAGQLFGRGLGGGSQSTLNFLPSQHTDFVFAVLAEKLGLLGAGVVLGLFGVVIWRGLKIAWEARDRLGTLLATGAVALLLIHIVITIGMNLGVAPVTGLPLPFIAYGGTNLVVSLFLIGLLESIAIHNQELQFKQ